MFVTPLFAARCITCVANETPNGWWYLSGIILTASAIVAGWFIWQDSRARARWAEQLRQPPEA